MQTINDLIERLEEDSYPPNDNGVALRELDFTELRRLVGDKCETLVRIEEVLCQTTQH